MSRLPRQNGDNNDLSWASRGAGANDFSAEEKDAIQRCLRLNLGPEFISYRPSPGGGKVAYLEGCRAIELANETFGFSGWSSWIKDLSVDFVKSLLFCSSSLFNIFIVQRLLPFSAHLRVPSLIRPKMGNTIVESLPSSELSSRTEPSMM